MHWQRKGEKFRALLSQSIVRNRLTVADIERDTSVDEKQIGRSLKAGQGLNPPVQLVAYLLWADQAGVILGGLADMLGYEIRPKQIDLAAENRRLRSELADVRARIDGALGGL